CHLSDNFGNQLDIGVQDRVVELQNPLPASLLHARMDLCWGHGCSFPSGSRFLGCVGYSCAVAKSGTLTSALPIAASFFCSVCSCLIFSCNFKIPSMRDSGRGGHPGTYTS